MPKDLILTRAATPSPPPVDLPASHSLHAVTHPSDSAFLLLDRLYASAGFPADWAGKMLERDAQAVVIDADGIPAAAAMLIRRPLYIDEIRRTLDPGPDADYYFGDFVATSFRGRHLQRSLIRARLRMRERGLNQKIDTLIIQNVEVIAIHARYTAMPVTHVFAQTHIRNYNELRTSHFDGAQCFLDNTVFRVSPARLFVFLTWNSKEKDCL